MSDTEKKIRDTRGKFLYAVKNGNELREADWQECRVVLTSERLAMIGDGKETVPLEAIEDFGGRYDVSQAARQEAHYTAITVENDVYLVSLPEHDGFETDLYRAVLNGQIMFVKHPAVEGGVVQDAGWTKARLQIGDDRIRIAMADGGKTDVDRDDIGDVELDERTVEGQRREIVEVEHTEGDLSVETHITGADEHVAVLRELVMEGVERTEANLDLSPTEKRVIMALHSGVSPFAIPEFVGISVEKTSEIYDRLIELDVIEVVRERTEVEITPQGRSVASETMANQ